VYEPSSCRTIFWSDAGGVDSNHAVTLARRWAVEIGE